MNKIIVHGKDDKIIGEIGITKCGKAQAFKIGKYNPTQKILKTGFYSMQEFNTVYNMKTKRRYKEIERRCWKCNVNVGKVASNKIPLCDECKEKEDQYNNELKEQYRILGNKLKFKRAIEILCKQPNMNIEKYKEEIETIREYIEKFPTKFDSAHEVVAAIILLSSRINIKIQASINDYKVDFMLKDEFIILEIDGERHRSKLDYDFKRDVEIRNILGSEWEIIRIETKYIESNVEKLYDVLLDIYSYRKEVRKSNSGILPEWYSQRERAYNNN